MQVENVEEVWKDVIGYKNLYKVSNLGVVKRLARSRLRVNGRPLNLREKILKPNHIGNNYYQLKLTKNEVETTILLHRIICRAFHGLAPKGKNFVNHKDGNKENNRADNLEWCSFQENMTHAALHGLRPRGSGNHKHKITETEVLEICNLLDTKSISQNEIAAKYKVNPRTISSIKYGVSWNWLTKRRT